MTVIPIAAFLAGALLTLLLPVALLIALVVWYWVFSQRVPETTDQAGPDTATAAANPLQSAKSESGPPAHGG